MAQGEDVKGERGGDTGHTKQKGKGMKAEKGDQRRDEMGKHSGPTRPGANRHSRSGSDSGGGSNDK